MEIEFINQPKGPSFFLKMTLVHGNYLTLPYFFGRNDFNLSSLADEIEKAKTFSDVVRIEAYSIGVLPDDRYTFHEWNKYPS